MFTRRLFSAVAVEERLRCIRMPNTCRAKCTISGAAMVDPKSTGNSCSRPPQEAGSTVNGWASGSLNSSTSCMHCFSTLPILNLHFATFIRTLSYMDSYLSKPSCRRRRCPDVQSCTYLYSPNLYFALAGADQSRVDTRER